MKSKPPKLMVVLVAAGHAVMAQDYLEFQYGTRSLDLLLACRSKSLLDILQDQFPNMIISYNDKKEWVLTNLFIVEGKEKSKAMSLLGKIAEAVLVRRCHEDETLNEKLYKLATRKQKAQKSTVEQFKAIGTGLKDTKKNSPQKYSPSDTQRDIIWVDDDGKIALMSGSSIKAGIPAGIQVKVSLGGEKYIVKDLIKERYEVPMVYFPIQHDFERVFEKVKQTEKGKDICIGRDLVDIRTYDIQAFEEIKDYYPIVLGLITGEITPEKFVDMASGKISFENALLSHTLNTDRSFSVICG